MIFVFYVEKNIGFAYKFNKQITKCHDILAKNIIDKDYGEKAEEYSSFDAAFMEAAQKAEDEFDFAKIIE